MAVAIAALVTVVIVQIVTVAMEIRTAVTIPMVRLFVQRPRPIFGVNYKPH